MELPEKKALLIVNPVSGKKQVLRFLPDVIRRLMDAGYLVTAAVTSRRAEATELAERYGGEADLICCTGGDGTLNEVLSGLAFAGHSTPLGYIPCGSTNDFAASHALPTDITSAVEAVVSGRERRYDIGRFGRHYFSYVAAFGAFSWLSYTTDQNLKNVLGRTAYVLDGIRDLPKVRPYELLLEADGTRYEGSFLFGAVCNTISVAGTFELPEEEVDTCDGRLEVLLIREPRTLPELQEIVSGLLNREYSSPLIDFFHARRLRVVCPEDLDWSLDGEGPGHYDEAEIEVLPGFLRLIG